MMEAPAPMIVGPGGQQNGHGFVAGREAASMMKDFQKTGGDIAAVARTAAKNALTYAQEFGWGDVFSTFEYKVVDGKWTNNGRTLEDMNDPLEVGGDRIKRVLEAEKRMKEDPSIKQAVVASEDLKVGYDRHYLYVYTRDEQNPDHISALAIEFQGKESEFQNVLSRLSNQSNSRHENTPVSFSKPLFFKAEKTINVSDIHAAAQESFGSEDRKKEMGSYLSRLSRDTTQFEQLIKRREKQEQELQAKIEAMILQEPKVASGFAGIAHGIVQMIDTTLREDSRRRDVSEVRDMHVYKELKEPQVSSQLVEMIKNDDSKLPEKKTERKIVAGTVLRSTEKNEEKKAVAVEKNAIPPLLLALFQPKAENQSEKDGEQPHRELQTNTIQKSGNKALLQRENNDVEMVQAVAREIIQPLIPLIMVFLSEGMKSFEPSETPFIPSEKQEQIDTTVRSENISQTILKVFSPATFILEQNTDELRLHPTQHKEMEQKEEILTGFTKIISSVLRLGERGEFDLSGKDLEMETESMIFQEHVLQSALLLEQKISQEFFHQETHTIPDSLQRISLYVSLLKRIDTPSHLRELMAFLIQKEVSELNEQNAFSTRSGYQELFAMIQSVRSSERVLVHVEQFIISLEAIVEQKYGITIHLNPNDPTFCETVFSILIQLYLEQNQPKEKISKEEQKSIPSDDLIGYYLERMQSNQSTPAPSIFFARQGIIYQYMHASNTFVS